MGFFGDGDGGPRGGPADGSLPNWFDPHRDLSPVARGRLERTARSGVRASTLSAKEFAVLEPMGPTLIGEVLGACVIASASSGSPPKRAMRARTTPPLYAP
jgi:hypothetical protein